MVPIKYQYDVCVYVCVYAEFITLTLMFKRKQQETQKKLAEGKKQGERMV